MFKARRGAFTLIELLVVVAIIAVMIAIILPSLGRAKELARRASCAANLRSLGIGYRAYGNEFNDFCPIGVQGSGFVSDGSGDRDNRDGSFCMYTQNGAVCGWLGLGMPNAIGAFTGFGPYFCPTALINMPDRVPLTAKNAIWPCQLLGSSGSVKFGKGDSQGNLYDPLTGQVYGTGVNSDSLATYSVRATMPVGEAKSSSWAYWLVLQGGGYVKGDPRYYDTTFHVPLGYAYDAPYGGVGGQGTAMPKFATLRTNVVVAADFVCGSQYVDIVHKEGVNAMHVDGSAAWVPRAKFNKYLSGKTLDYQTSPLLPWQAPDFQGTGSSEPNIFANYYKVWDALDQN